MSTPAPAGTPLSPLTVPDDVVARLGPVVLRTFAQEDFHRVDMRTLARTAGMSFATIYRYFHDKEAMLFWFIAHWVRDLYEQALPMLDTDETVPVKLQNYLRGHLRFYERNPEVGRVVFLTVPLKRWMQDETYRADGAARRLLSFIATAQAQGQIRADVPALAVFDVWSGIFTRAFQMWEYRKRSYSLEAQWEPLGKILLAGIALPQVDAAAPEGAGKRRRASR